MMEDEANRTRTGFQSGGLGTSNGVGQHHKDQQQVPSGQLPGQQTGGQQTTGQPQQSFQLPGQMPNNQSLPSVMQAAQQAYGQQQALGQAQSNQPFVSLHPNGQQFQNLHPFQQLQGQYTNQQPLGPFQCQTPQQVLSAQQAPNQLLTQQQPNSHNQFPHAQQFLVQHQAYPTNPAAQLGPDPAFSNFSQTQQSTSSTSIQYFRNMMPFLAHVPDDFLISQPIDALFRLSREEKLAESNKAAKSLDIKLHENLKKASDNPIFRDGYDNRTSFLHPARFLPGAGVPVQQLWLEARKYWGQEGKDAIASYDLEALGCSGCITARGWDILHKPGSPELSLKLFTVANVGHSTSGAKTVSVSGEDGFTIHDSWKEVEDMAEFRRALDNLLIAAQLALPWNFSFLVLKGFLKSNDFMESDLSGYKKAIVLSGFVDHVFKINAGLWVQEAPFLDAAKLHALWKSWWCSRKTGLKTEANQQGGSAAKGKGAQSTKGSSKPGGFQANKGQHQNKQNIPPYSGPPSEKNICKRYNDKQCSNNHTNCTIKTKIGILRLHHLCNSMVLKDGNTTKTYCLEKHLRQEH